MANQNLFLGTCGWSYKNDWRDLFYPKELKPSQFLEFYSEIFNSVEIDSSFYRIPSKKYVKNWVETTSTNFYFSAKLPREITHKSYLNITMSNRYLKEYFLNISPIENQNRMIGHLVQLPPSFTFKKHLNNLESFLKIWKKLKKTLGTKIIKNMKNSKNHWVPIFEFRNKSWDNDKIFELLESYNAAYCNVIEPLIPFRNKQTRQKKDLYYIRFHGFGKKPWWDYLFSQEEINYWADKIRKIVKKNPKTNFAIYFNNHYSGNAVKNALDIKTKLGLPEVNIENIKEKYIRKKPIKNTKSLDNWINKT